jgi:hypothetical protein
VDNYDGAREAHRTAGVAYSAPVRKWLLRGVCMGILHGLVQAAQADIRARHPDVVGMTTPLALVVVVGVAVLWAGLDGWQRRPVDAGTWFVAGLLAGPLAGLLAVVVRALMVDATGLEALVPALTGGAAFTALLVAGPAAIANRALSRRPRPPSLLAGTLDQSRGNVRPDRGGVR